MFYHRDPRRAQPLVDELVDRFNSVDFNGESTFGISQVLCFYRAFYEELGWRFEPWADDMIARAWPEIGCEHDEVRSYIGEMLAVAEKAKVSRQPLRLSKSNMDISAGRNHLFRPLKRL